MARLAVLACLVFTCFSQAKGLSPYLPLNVSPEVEAQIDKVMALTPAAPVTKPYKAAELHRRLKLIKGSHPVLYKNLSQYLQRFTESRGLTHGAITIAESDDQQLSVLNDRNIKQRSNYQIELGSVAYLSPYVYASAGFIYDQNDGLTHYNTHLALGNEYVQMELGYREHWFSPFKDSAMLVSTHAKASPSITISNATPYTDWNIRFEMFYSQLENVDAIVLGDETFPGKPRHAGLHLSFTPFDFWTVGLNRTLQFGGGKREVSVGDVFEALFDPAGKDNVGDVVTDDINFEFGNQQASVTSQFNFDFYMPISVYAEYAGEDTVNESNFQLGNDAKSLGIYLPVVTDDVSLRYEVSDWSTRWYVHHLYPDGYTNDGQIMGHWGASLRTFAEDTPATSHMVNAVWRMADNQVLDVTLRTLTNENTATTQYERSVQAQARYSFANRYGFWGVELNGGKDTFGESFYRVAAFYRW